MQTAQIYLAWSEGSTPEILLFRFAKGHAQRARHVDKGGFWSGQLCAYTCPRRGPISRHSSGRNGAVYDALYGSELGQLPSICSLETWCETALLGFWIERSSSSAQNLATGSMLKHDEGGSKDLRSNQSGSLSNNSNNVTLHQVEPTGHHAV